MNALKLSKRTKSFLVKYVLLPISLFFLYAIVQALSVKKNIILNIIAYIITLCLAIYVHKKPKIKFEKTKYNKTWIRRLGIVIAGLFLIISFDYMIKALAYSSGISSANQQELVQSIKNVPFKSLITIIIIGPIFEETIFRRCLITFTNEKTILTSYIISALIFGIMHMANTSFLNPVIIMYIVPGLAFGAIYIITRKLEYSIIAHVLYNFLAALPIILAIIK